MRMRRCRAKHSAPDTIPSPSRSMNKASNLEKETRQDSALLRTGCIRLSFVDVFRLANLWVITRKYPERVVTTARPR
jgi:hypothetical protein